MRLWFYLLIAGSVFMGCFSANASTMSIVQNLFFGTWIPTATFGSVIVSTSGTTTPTGVTIAPGGTIAIQGILKFSSTGSLGAVLDVITLTPLSSSVTLTGGVGGSVRVGSFVPKTGLGVTLLSPNVDIPMGGTMSFTGTPRGTFSGSIQVQGSGLLSGSAIATLPISVTFWRTLTVTEETSLNFGAIEARGGSAIVQLNAATGARMVTSGAGNVNLVSSPTPSAGQFSVKGQNSTNVTVTLPSSITLTRSGGGTMTVNNFTKSPSSTSLDGSGELTLRIGADLNIGASQQPGVYNGTYTLTVNY